MADHYSPLLDTTCKLEDGRHSVLVEAIVDDEGEYTGRYRITVDGKQQTELRWLADDSWEENVVGNTEIARVVGGLIASNEE